MSLQTARNALEQQARPVRGREAEMALELYVSCLDMKQELMDELERWQHIQNKPKVQGGCVQFDAVLASAASAGREEVSLPATSMT